MEQQNYQQKFNNLWYEISKLKDEMAGKEYELKEEMDKGMAQMNEENVDLKLKNRKSQEENLTLKKKITKLENYMKELKSSIRRRKMPAELLNQLFGALPLENAFNLLAKMPNGLLAENVQKMIKRIKIAMKSNKWNVDYYGPRVALSEDDLVVEHSGPEYWCSVLALLPIPTFNLIAIHSYIAFYFEVHILGKMRHDSTCIGLYCQHFPYYEYFVHEKNSIGFNNKAGMYTGGSYNRLENGCGDFRQGGVIGIGIIGSPENVQKKCFATCNGKLLGIVELPEKFANIKLFPAVTLRFLGDSIRANFGKEEWRFKEFDKLLI